MMDISPSHALRQSPIMRPAGLAALALTAVAVALLVTTGSRITLSLFAQATIISILALSVGFLARTAHLISFGHAAPFGLGAYGTALVFQHGVPAEGGLLLVVVAVFALFFLIGLVVGAFFIVRSNFHSAISVFQDGNKYLLRVRKDLSFVHKWELKRQLSMIPENSFVLIDLSKVSFVDLDNAEIINDFLIVAIENNITVKIKQLPYSQYLFLDNLTPS